LFFKDTNDILGAILMAQVNDKIALILTYYYPPSSAAGAQRLQNLVKVALDVGWKVEVVTLQETTGNDETKWSCLERNLHVLRIDHYLALQAACKSNTASELNRKNYAKAVFWLLCNRALIKFNRVYISLKLSRAADVIIRKRNPSVIISSGPPFTLHKIAAGLKKKFDGLFWIADFRDPWVYPGTIQSLDELPNNSPFKKTFNSANCLSIVTQGHYDFLDILDNRSIKPRGHLLLAPNGTKIDLYEKVSTCEIPESRDINIGYLGDITYTHRSPKSLVLALEHLVSCGEDVALHFWTNITPYTRWEGEGLEEIIENATLADYVHVNPYVSRAEALSFQKSLDLLVLFALNQPIQIPSKAYEYLVSDKPIIAICDEGGETYNLLTQYEGVFLVTENTPDSVSQGLSAALKYVHHLKKTNGEVLVGRKHLNSLSYYSGFKRLLDEAD